MTPPASAPTFLETLSPDDRILYAIMVEEERRKKEAVSPKMELARNFKGKIIGARGGRSAGAKTTSMVSLNVQQSHRGRHRVVCLREIQESLEESLYQSVEECVDRLELPGWRFPRSQGYCESPTGSHWIFRGLKDLRAARNTKGLQGFDRFIMDEAATIIGESLDMVIPLLGKVAGSQLWFAYNPETDADPIFTKIWLPYQNDPDALLLDMLPEGADNPWWNSDAQKLSDKMRHDDPDLWEHVYGGKPRSQGDKSVLPRVAISAALGRPAEAGKPKEAGVDVARFGDDKTTAYVREGMKVTKAEVWAKLDTQETARRVWDLVGRDPTVPIKVDDSGVGCITENTKVLTSNGWLPAPELKAGQSIYSSDGNGNVVLETIRSVKRWDSVRVLKRDGYEFSFSHVMPYRTRRKYPEKETSWENILDKATPYLSTEFKYEAASSNLILPSHEITMPNGGTKIVRNPIEVDGKDFCSFLGWFVSEGHLDGGKVGITQKKQHNLSEIERVMSIFGSQVTKKKDGFTMSNITLAKWLSENAYKSGTGFYSKTVPRFVANNSIENINAFLDAFVGGDGFLHHGKRTYCTSSRWLVDDLVELIMKIGRTAGTYLKYATGSTGTIHGRTLTRTADHFSIYEFSPTQDNGTRALKKGIVETTIEPVYELSITGASKLFMTMCSNRRPIWTHNGGVTDKLRDLGAKVVAVNFGGKPDDEEKYTSVADEMWFTFGEIIDQVGLPDDPLLLEELGGRQYKYTSKDQRKIEGKDEFKKRLGRSPDRADGLLLCFYRREEIGFPMAFS